MARKAAATLSSTGTPAAFVHPVEALHGDLGIVRDGSALLALSKSGGNEETIEFARQFKAVAGGTGRLDHGARFAPGRVADIALHIPALPEIDEFDLAPTTSAVTTMAVCDALAILVQQTKGLTDRDFARFHPSGALGKRLLLSVEDLMVKGDALPIIGEDERSADLVFEITSKGIGMAVVVDRRRAAPGRGHRCRHPPPAAAPRALERAQRGRVRDAQPARRREPCAGGGPRLGDAGNDGHRLPTSDASQ